MLCVSTSSSSVHELLLISVSAGLLDKLHSCNMADAAYLQVLSASYQVLQADS